MKNQITEAYEAWLKDPNSGFACGHYDSFEAGWKAALASTQQRKGGGIPTPEEVTAYSASIGYPLDGNAWCDFYEAKGWMVGRTKMKNWQAAVRNWKSNGWTVGRKQMDRVATQFSTVH